jgi:hypothetical protein
VTLYIDAETAANLTTYTGLTIAIAEWLERDDLTDRIPDFIRLAEARFRRELVMPDMEVQVALTPAVTVPLPADFDSIRAMGIPGYDAFDQLSPADFSRLPNDTNDLPPLAQPTKFTIIAGNFNFWPTPDKSYAAKLTYRANLPSLGLTMQSNWLYDKHPDIYLFGSLLHAEFHGWNDNRLPLIKSAVDEMLGEIMMSGTRKRYGSGPLTMKPATSERIGLRW